MKKIAVITATRAEYGLLSPVIYELRKYESIHLKIELIVTGTHLNAKYGMTVNEIRASKERIDHLIPVSVKSESEIDISSNQAEVLVKFTHLFKHEGYNAVILLGDRYEILAIAIAAGNARIPIFHLCGGDTTEGALDEWIRHAVTKMSYLHFVTNEDSKKRVLQLGESPDRVFNYGSTSIDNIIHMENLPKKDALASIGLSECKYAICTYHPVTMENGTIDGQIESFLNAIKIFQDITFIVTKSNADQGGSRINDILDQADDKIENIHVFSSLGVRRYLSLMKYAEFVLGNSSSGIIEAPAFHVPTINIGDRQRGRLQAESIINCEANTKAIIKAIRISLSNEHRNICQNVQNPYGSGDAAKRIASKSIEVIMSEHIDLKKKFYNISI